MRVPKYMAPAAGQEDHCIYSRIQSLNSWIRKADTLQGIRHIYSTLREKALVLEYWVRMSGQKTGRVMKQKSVELRTPLKTRFLSDLLELILYSPKGERR